MKDYRTVEGRARAELEEKRSRFIASLAFADTEQRALDFLAEIREANRTARHNVYAYILREGNRTRYSDDGEPPKTAGLPVLEVLTHAGLTDCVLVVTRYFGGILLGTGGLVRAYSHTCALALNAAPVCEMHPTEKWLFEVAYPLWDKVQHTLRALPVRQEGVEFTTSVAFELSMKAADSQTVQAELTRITDGRIEGLLEEESYSPWVEEPQG